MSGQGFSVSTSGIPLIGVGTCLNSGQFNKWNFPITTTGPGPDAPIIPGLFPLTIPLPIYYSNPSNMIDLYSGIFTIPGTGQTYSMDVNVSFVVSAATGSITDYQISLLKKTTTIGLPETFIMGEASDSGIDAQGAITTIQVTSGDQFTIQGLIFTSDCFPSLSISGSSINTTFNFRVGLTPM